MLRSMSTYYRYPFLILKFRRPGRINPGPARTEAFGENYRVFPVSLSIFTYMRDLRW